MCRIGEIEYREYDESHWMLLRDKRWRAHHLAKPLLDKGFNVYMYGSLARGDINLGSDIDLIILNPVNPVIVLTCFSNSGLMWRRIYIIQATPSHIPKVYIWFDDLGKEVISFPLSELSSRESDFFRFGGLLDVRDYGSDHRVPGVDKRLMFIKPIEKGHTGICIIGREGWVAGELGISESVVRERVSVLSRRRRHGRTGVFIEYEVMGDIMEAIEYLARENEFFAKKIGF